MKTRRRTFLGGAVGLPAGFQSNYLIDGGMTAVQYPGQHVIANTLCITIDQEDDVDGRARGATPLPALRMACSRIAQYCASSIGRHPPVLHRDGKRVRAFLRQP